MKPNFSRYNFGGAKRLFCEPSAIRKERNNEFEDRILQVDEERYQADMHIERCHALQKRLKKLKKRVEESKQKFLKWRKFLVDQ